MNTVNSEVAALAAQAMGIPDPAANPAAGQQQPAPAPDPKAPVKPTNQDKAADKGGPQTEGDKSQAEAVVYDIKVGDRTRKLTPQQISSTLERYADLNYKQSQIAPIMSVISKLREENPNIGQKELAEHIAAFGKAGEKNTTLGKGSENVKPDTRGQAVSGDDMGKVLTKWENDNAVSLPPGYKEMMQGNGQNLMAMQQQMQQMQKALQMVLAQAGGTADAARVGMQSAQQQQIDVRRQQIAANLDRVQSALQIPAERGKDFFMFAAERGYTMEDFIDPGMVVTVMQDFKRDMDSPEMERMRSIAQRRQAVTGSMGAGLPGSAHAAPEGASPAGSSFDQMAAQAMAKRGLS